MSSDVIGINRIDDGRFGVKIVFIYCLFGDDSGELVERDIIHVEVHNKFQHERFNCISTRCLKHRCQNSEKLKIPCLGGRGLPIIKLDELDYCMPKAESIGHGSDLETRRFMDPPSGDVLDAAMVREATYREGRSRRKFLQSRGEVKLIKLHL